MDGWDILIIIALVVLSPLILVIWVFEASGATFLQAVFCVFGGIVLHALLFGRK